jgi:CheY-like chemotaxis protein
MADKPKILLVDDERAITSNLAPLLERSGFVVAVAADGEEALRQVADFQPDLVVLDILMPRLDGREVLRRLRQADNWTPSSCSPRSASPRSGRWPWRKGPMTISTSHLPHMNW